MVREVRFASREGGHVCLLPCLEGSLANAFYNDVRTACPAEENWISVGGILPPRCGATMYPGSINSSLFDV